MWLIVEQIPIKADGDMLPSHSGILAKARSIAFTSLQQRQSISFASFLQCKHFKSSRSELLCKKSCLRPATLFKKRLWHRCFPINFMKFLKTPFFTEHFQWLAFATLKIPYSNTLCNTSAAEAWICLVSFSGGVKDFIFKCIFLRIITFFIKI